MDKEKKRKLDLVLYGTAILINIFALYIIIFEFDNGMGWKIAFIMIGSGWLIAAISGFIYNLNFWRYKMLKISDILRNDFEWDEIQIDEDEFEELSAELVIDFLEKNTPKERQLLAISWNFDNSKKVIRWIVEQPDTDKGTILYLYWYMAPAFYKENYANRKECEEENPWSLEDYDIIDTIEKNYLSDFYTEQLYAFHPTDDVYSGGYDWTKEYDESKVKAKIPNVMFKALDGEILENPGWEEGIPTALSEIMDKLCDALDE